MLSCCFEGLRAPKALAQPLRLRELRKWCKLFVDSERAWLFLPLCRWHSVQLTGHDIVRLCLASRKRSGWHSLTIVLDLDAVQLEPTECQRLWWEPFVKQLVELARQELAEMQPGIVFIRCRASAPLASLGPSQIVEGGVVEALKALRERGLFSAIRLFKDHREPMKESLSALPPRKVSSTSISSGSPGSRQSSSVTTLNSMQSTPRSISECSTSSSIIYEELKEIKRRNWFRTTALPWAASKPAEAKLQQNEQVARPKEPKELQSLDTWWPQVEENSDGVAFAVQPAGLDRGTRPAFEGDALEMVQRLQDIAHACRAVRHGRARSVCGLTIKCLVEEGRNAVWFAEAPSSPVMLVASEVLLQTSLPVEAVLWALYSVKERMQWDGSTFSAYEVLWTAAAQQSTKALGDFIYCRIPFAAGIADRDVVQERYLTRLGPSSYAIAIHSCSASTCRELQRTPRAGAVRATTILSGYLLRPDPHGRGVVLTGLSQTDVGGLIPQWLQSCVKKAGKRKPIDWAMRLQDYCNSKERRANWR